MEYKYILILTPFNHIFSFWPNKLIKYVFLEFQQVIIVDIACYHTVNIILFKKSMSDQTFRTPSKYMSEPPQSKVINKSCTIGLTNEELNGCDTNNHIITFTPNISVYRIPGHIHHQSFRQ